jgi:hypothetical protein
MAYRERNMTSFICKKQCKIILLANIQHIDDGFNMVLDAEYIKNRLLHGIIGI